MHHHNVVGDHGSKPFSVTGSYSVQPSLPDTAMEEVTVLLSGSAKESTNTSFQQDGDKPFPQPASQ